MSGRESTGACVFTTLCVLATVYGLYCKAMCGA